MEVPDYPPDDLGRPKSGLGPLRRALGRLRRGGRAGGGQAPIHIADPSYEEWPVARDYEDAATARAFLQSIEEAGIPAVLTSDWPLDRFGRGDVALRVPPGMWSEAEEFLSGLDLDD